MHETILKKICMFSFIPDAIKLMQMHTSINKSKIFFLVIFLMIEKIHAKTKNITIMQFNVFIFNNFNSYLNILYTFHIDYLVYNIIYII